MEHGQHISDAMRQCITNCRNCAAICTEMIAHCLRLGGPHAAPDHIRLQLDCAQIWGASADYMVRMSPFHHQTCGVCAEVCRRCAEDCERLAAGDDMMTRCTELCRQCAESCERMAASGVR